MEPFSIILSKDQVKLREDLNPKIEAVRELSEEFKTLLVPLDKIFSDAVKEESLSSGPRRISSNASWACPDCTIMVKGFCCLLIG